MILVTLHEAEQHSRKWRPLTDCRTENFAPKFKNLDGANATVGTKSGQRNIGCMMRVGKRLMDCRCLRWSVSVPVYAELGYRHISHRCVVKEEVEVVPGGGVEPPRPEGRRILSPLRLPVPPSRHFVEVLNCKAVFLLNHIVAQCAERETVHGLDDSHSFSFLARGITYTAHRLSSQCHVETEYVRDSTIHPSSDLLISREADDSRARRFFSLMDTLKISDCARAGHVGRVGLQFLSTLHWKR